MAWIFIPKYLCIGNLIPEVLCWWHLEVMGSGGCWLMNRLIHLWTCGVMNGWVIEGWLSYKSKCPPACWLCPAMRCLLLRQDIARRPLANVEAMILDLSASKAISQMHIYPWSTTQSQVMCYSNRKWTVSMVWVLPICILESLSFRAKTEVYLASEEVPLPFLSSLPWTPTWTSLFCLHAGCLHYYYWSHPMPKLWSWINYYRNWSNAMEQDVLEVCPVGQPILRVLQVAWNPNPDLCRNCLSC